MSNYYQLKNTALLTPPPDTDLGGSANPFADVFVQNQLTLGDAILTGATIVTPKIASIAYIGNDTAADIAERQTIRDRYAAVQTTIDSAQDSDQLLTVLQTL